MTTDLFGPLPVRASRIRMRASAPVMMIQGTFGRTYIGSSVPPASQDMDLLFSWENRLRQRLAKIGSSESALIWSVKEFAPGLSISRLAPSTLHTNGSDNTGAAWRTPLETDKKWRGTPNVSRQREADGRSIGVQDQMIMTAVPWPTPTTSDGGRDKDGKLTGSNLTTYLHHWPTPKAGSAGETSRSGDRMNEPLIGGLMRAAGERWSTPRESDGRKGSPNQEFSNGSTPLPTQIYSAASLGTWVTPSSRDWKDSANMSIDPGERASGQLRLDQLPRQMVVNDQITANIFPPATIRTDATMSVAVDILVSLVEAFQTESDGPKTMGIWPTVTSLSFDKSHQPGNSASMNKMKDLWPTARVEAGQANGDAKFITGRRGRGNIEDLMATNRTIGATPNGSSATTAKRGAPNPIFAFWLMGFPVVWICGALQAMRLSRRKPLKR